MKKAFSAILAVIMLLSCLTGVVSAMPYDECLKLDDVGGYMYFQGFSSSANNTKISFDISMAADSHGAPAVQFNIDGFRITPTQVTLHGKTTTISWGDVALNHWKHIDVIYDNGTATLQIGGITVLTANGTCRSEGMVIQGWPGTTYIDNLVVESNGNTMLYLDFEDEWNYVSHKSSDSTAVRGKVPADSYMDEVLVIPDNVEYIFDKKSDCEKLVVATGKKVLVGDLDNDGLVSGKDSRLLKMILSGYLNDYDKDVADIDKNGTVNAMDSQLMRSMVAGGHDAGYVEVTGGGSAEFDAMMQSALLTAESAVADGVDATLTLDEKLDPADYKYAIITYMTPNKTDDKNSEAAVQSAFGSYGNFITYDLVNDGRFHSQVVDLSQISTWNGDVVTLRFFVAANAGDRIYIDSIIFSADAEKSDAASANRTSAKKPYKWVDDAASDENPDILGEEVDGVFAIRFNSEGRINNFVSVGNNSRFGYDEDEDSLEAVVTGASDPSIYLDLKSAGLSAGTYGYMTYVYRIPSGVQREGPSGNFYYVCGNIDVPTGGYETALYSLKKTGQYCTITIPMNAKSNWSGLIKGLRIDYYSDAYVGDRMYIDSIAFTTTQAKGEAYGQQRLDERNGAPEPGTLSAQGLWQIYRVLHKNANSNEFITGSETNYQMYFRYGSKDKLTERSLADRFARAIKQATGYDVTCTIDVHSAFLNLYNNFDNGNSAGVYYTINFNGWDYVIWVPTTIIKDTSYSDPLDGTASDYVYSTPNANTWFSEGYNVTDSVSLQTSNTGLVEHSNHETRMVRTPYGTFVVFPTWANQDSWGTIGGATATVFRVYDNGTYSKLFSFDFAYHTTKPNIMYAADGNVYVVCGDDQGSSASIYVAYFDPQNPSNVKSGRTSKAYSGGAAPGGYGYSQPILDDTNGKIYLMACGGSGGAGYLTWFIYDYKTHQWESNGYTAVLNGTYRHCYLYGYSDGANGLYVVGGRDVLLTTLGLGGVIANVNYAWDEVNVIHFPNMHSTNFTLTHVTDADYSQQDRQMYPASNNSTSGDAFLTSDGYLHVIANEQMHDRNNSGTYEFLWHAVYDVKAPGATPTLVYRKPVQLISPKNLYASKFVEGKDGTLYLIAITKGQAPRAEIWKASGKYGENLELMAVRNFSDSSHNCTSGIVATNSRNGSINDGTVNVIYPTNNNDWVTYYYKFFTVTLP